MCDFVSWIETGESIYFLTDDEIDAKWPDCDYQDKIGHSAIEKYFPEANGGKHCESWGKVPLVIADMVNRGKMAKMAKISGWAGIHFDNKGRIDCDYWKNVEKLIRKIKKNSWFDNHGEISGDVKMFETRSAAWSAARSAAWSAARSAAWSAARSAAWSAARSAACSAACSAAWSAAWSAAGDAARAAAGDAAGDAAWDAARDAAWDAEIFACCYISLMPNSPHFQHAQKRMGVWFAGYGVLCDIDGVIYAYKRP